ncbi:MAG: thioesterase-3 [Pseudohongiellaceae bacterium]|jgi:thioesterase-3
MSQPPHEICTEFTVRSYETDSYAHLNNGVYISWFEHGRQLWLKSRGFSYDGLAARKQWFVVARTEVDFRRPLDEGQTVELGTVVEKLGRTSVRWRQVIRASTQEARVSDPPSPPESAVIAEAFTVMVFSGEGGGSILIPDDFRDAAELPAP